MRERERENLSHQNVSIAPVVIEILGIVTCSDIVSIDFH